jgi:cytochrome c553
LNPGIAIAAALLLALAGCDRAPTAPVPKAVMQFEPVTLARPQAAATGAPRGERLARVLGCTGCHGDDLTGYEWFEDPRIAVLYTSNLTRAVPLYSGIALERALRSGVRHDGSALWGMPSELFRHLSEADMTALIAWLRTLRPAGIAHPRMVLGPIGRRQVAQGEIKSTPQYVREDGDRWPARLDGRHEWARYMTRATCAECHGIDLAGPAEPEPGPGAPPDLAIVGAYSRDQFRHLLRTGVPPSGRDLRLMSQVSRGRFAHLTEREVDAIYDYLVARASRPQ